MSYLTHFNISEKAQEVQDEDFTDSDTVRSLSCKHCGADRLEVLVGSYITYVRCNPCGIAELIHSG